MTDETQLPTREEQIARIRQTAIQDSMREQEQAQRAAARPPRAPAEDPEISALRQTKSRIGEVEKYQKQRLADFDSKAGKLIAEKPSEDGSGGELLALDDLEKQAEERVGTIRGAFTTEVAGEPTEGARRARQRMGELLQQARAYKPDVGGISGLKQYREALKQERARIAEQQAAATARKTEAELKYGARMAALYGPPPAAPVAPKPVADAAARAAAEGRPATEVPEVSFWGEFGKNAADLGRSFASGAGGLVKMVGDIYGLATGDMDNATSNYGAYVQDFWEEGKSADLRARESVRQQAMAATDSEFGKALQWVKATVSDPSLLANSVGEQIANIVPGAGAGALTTKAASKILLRKAVSDAARIAAARAAVGIGTAAGVATGAAVQGADVGADSYAETLAALETMPDEQAATIPEIAAALSAGEDIDVAKAAYALEQGRQVGIGAAALSLLTNALPGGNLIERAAARGAAGAAARGAAGTLGREVAKAGAKVAGEAASEVIEEGGGQVLANVAAREGIEPNRPLTQGVGAAAGPAALVGGVFGGPAAASEINLRAPQAAQSAETVMPTAPEPAPDAAPDEAFTPEVDDELAAQMAANDSTAGTMEGQTAATGPASAVPVPISSAPVDPAAASPALDNPSSETPVPSAAETLSQEPPVGDVAAPTDNTPEQKPTSAGSTPALATTRGPAQSQPEAMGVASPVSGEAPAPVSRPPDEAIQITVQQRQGSVPGFVQVDEIRDGKSTGSANPFDARARGIDIPEVPEWLPSGRYTLAEVRKAIADGPPASPQPAANPADEPAPQTLTTGDEVTTAGATTSTPENLEGEKISREWRAYSPESKSLNIPRAEMPQIPNEARGALVGFLKARGIAAKQEEVSPGQLKPTQAEYSEAKVRKAVANRKEFGGQGRAILISADDHVVDGHHQWMAALEDAPNEPMRVIRLAAPIRDVLAQVREFPSTENGSGAKPTSPTPAATSDQPQETPQPTPASAPAAGPISTASTRPPDASKKAEKPDTSPGPAVKESLTAAPAPIVARGQNKPAEFVRAVAKATGLKASAKAAKVLMDFAPRLHRAAPAEFEQMEVHALTAEQWAATPATSRMTPDSAAAYDPVANTLYLNTGKLQSAEDIVSSIVHEAGHFAERFALGVEFTQGQWEALTHKQRNLAFKDYAGRYSPQSDNEAALKADSRARAEWVAMQFARVVRGDTASMGAQLKARLAKFLASMREFVNKWVGDGRLSTAELDARIVAAMFPGEQVTKTTSVKPTPSKPVSPPADPSAPSPSLPAPGGVTALVAVAEKTEIADLNVTVADTASGPVVAPTASEDKKVARMPDRKQLRVQKEFLVEVLNEAARTAPDQLVMSGEGAIDMALPLFGDGTPSGVASAKQNLAALGEKYGVKTDEASVAFFGLGRGKDGTMSITEKIAQAIRSRHAEHVTVEVPGDGTFRVPNTKADIRRLADRVKKQFGTGIGAISPRTPPTGARPVAPLAKKVTPDAVTKAVSLSVAEEPLTDNKGNQNQRAVLNYTVQDGAFTVATNGRVLTVATGGGGMPKAEVEKKGYKVPNWRQIMEASKKLIKLGDKTISPQGKPRATGDSGEILKVLNRIEGLREEKKEQSVFIHVVDGKIGISFQSSKIGDFRSENVPAGHRAVAAVSPDYLRTVAETARSLGVEQIDLHTAGTAEDWRNPLVFFAGDKAVSVVMPIRANAEGADIFAPDQGSATLGTPAEPAPELTDAEKDAARRELAGTELNPPKNAPVPGQPGKRFRSYTDTQIERGYGAVREVYQTKPNAQTRDAARAFIDAVGDAVAAEAMFDRNAELSEPVRTDIGNQISGMLARRRDAATTPEQFAEASAAYQRFAARAAERLTELGQGTQAADMLDIFTKEGAITAAGRNAKQRQDRALGENGRETEKEIVDAMNAENGKVVDALLKDVKDDVKKVRVSKKMVERAVGEIPKTKKELDAAIRKAFADAGRNIADIIRTHVTEVDAIGSNLVDKLQKEAGLSPGEAEKLADAVRTRLAQKTLDAKKKVLTRLAKTKGGISRRMFTLIDKIVEMSNAGALDQPALRERIAEELKLPRVTDALAARLKELTEKRLTVPEGFQRDRIDSDILTELRKTEGIGTVDVATAIYYAHILSGYTTQLVNIISTAMNTAADVTLTAATAEADALFRRNGAKLGTPTTQALIGLFTGAKMGWAQALATLDTGYANKAFGEKLPDVAPVLEILSKEPATGVGKGLKGYAWALRYITRSMKAADAVFYRSASEAFQRVAAAKIAGAMEGGSLDRAEANRRIRDLLAMSPAEFESARRQATGEGLTGYDHNLRVAELIEQRRRPDVTQSSARSALESTFNNHPRGALGWIAEGIAGIAKKVPALKLFVPFTNIVANVTNASLNYSPLGFSRAAFGYSGESAMSPEDRKTKGIPSLKEERAMLNAKAFAGTMAMLSLLAYALSGDEDEPAFITANGPKDIDRRNQLRQSGWKPHSIKIGDAYVSYLASPMAVPLAFVGNWVDGVRYNDLGKGDTLTNATQAFVGIGSTITEMSFLSGVADLFDTLRGKPGASPEKWLGNVATTAVVPNLVRQLDRTFDPTLRQGDGLAGQLQAAIPGARQELPARLTPTARPIESQPLGRFGGIATNDPLWDTLNAKGAVISSMSSAKVNNRAATPEEVRLIIQDSGPAIERRLRAALPAIERMNNEQAEKFVQSVAREERARSRDRLPVLMRRALVLPDL